MNFLFCTDKPVTVEWPNPARAPHTCMTVARFTLLADNFVARSFQVTKHFGTWDWITGALSAKIPGNFGPSANFEISVLREMSERIVFPWFHFW